MCGPLEFVGGNGCCGNGKWEGWLEHGEVIEEFKGGGGGMEVTIGKIRSFGDGGGGRDRCGGHWGSGGH